MERVPAHLPPAHGTSELSFCCDPSNGGIAESNAGGRYNQPRSRAYSNMEPIDTYGEEGNAADDVVLLSHTNPTTPLHHVTLTAKPHAFAGAVLTPKHARELTPALVLSVVVSLAEQASSTKGGGSGGGGSASVTGSISGASAAVAAAAHHLHTPSGASSIGGGGGHGGVPPAPPSPSLPHSPPNLGRRPSSSSHASAHAAGAIPGVANADAAFRTIQQSASTDSGFGGGGGAGGSVSGTGGGSGGGMAAGGGAQMPLSPNAVAAKFCESRFCMMVCVEYMSCMNPIDLAKLKARYGVWIPQLYWPEKS